MWMYITCMFFIILIDYIHCPCTCLSTYFKDRIKEFLLNHSVYQVYKTNQGFRFSTVILSPSFIDNVTRFKISTLWPGAWWNLYLFTKSNIATSASKMAKFWPIVVTNVNVYFFPDQFFCSCYLNIHEGRH